MNERIKLLAEQAKEETDALYAKLTPQEFKDTYNQKFAELIVRECVRCCEQVISDPVPESVDTWLNGGEQCIVEIKTHFGVEE